MYVNDAKLNETKAYIGYRVSSILALTIGILSSVCKAASCPSSYNPSYSEAEAGRA